jgi:hypothetical protein
MAQAITSGTLSEKWLKFDPDWIGEAQALPNATSSTSAEFEAGYDQGKLAIAVQADTTVNLDTTETLLYELLYDATSGGDFTNSVTIGSLTGGVVEIGDFLFPEYIPAEIGPFCKLKRTASGDQSAEKVNEFLRAVPS